MDEISHLSLKSLHILGAILFLGNIIVTGWWKVMADRTRHPHVVAFAQRQVTRADFLFTAVGAALLLVSGNALFGGADPWRVGWAASGLLSFIASGLVWVVVLIPVQIQQARMARAFEVGCSIPPKYWFLGRVWIAFGIIATALPLLNLYWMVFKPV